ncbi:adhesion G protein-coupled receptor L4-like [Ptychodera flava]|uniref:adhesion G protein-coupled receptor L4-like n=1 Tax=Ptychodera flava TaxID=63121 RepID=UPI00396A0A73
MRYCQSLGGGLVNIKTNSTLDSVNAMILSHDRDITSKKWWLALERESSRSQVWVWSDREVSSVFYWNTDQPGNRENCVHTVQRSMKWNDVSCDSTGISTLCEIHFDFPATTPSFTTAEETSGRRTTAEAAVIPITSGTVTTEPPITEALLVPTTAGAASTEGVTTEVKVNPIATSETMSGGIATTEAASATTGVRFNPTARAETSSERGATTETQLIPTTARTASTRGVTTEGRVNPTTYVGTSSEGRAPSAVRMPLTTRPTTSSAFKTCTPGTTTEWCSKDVNGPGIVWIQDRSSAFLVCRPGFRLSYTERSHIKCNSGYWSASPFPQCTDIDECLEDMDLCSPYETDRYCANTIGSYHCHCQDDFHLFGQLCLPLSLLEMNCDPGGTAAVKKCAASADEDTGTSWETTDANCSTEWVDCPIGSSGKMMRFCDETGTWWPPFTTECKSDTLINMKEKVNGVNSTTSATNVVTEITEAIAVGQNFYAGDMLLSGRFVSAILNKYPMSLPGTDDEKRVYAQNVVEMASISLDAGKETMWRLIHETRGSDKGSVEWFRMLGLFASDVHAHIHPIQGRIHIPTKNIDFEALVVRPDNTTLVFRSTDDDNFPVADMLVRKKRSSQLSPEMDTNNSLVVIPPETFESDTLGNYTVIAYIYYNPADIVPAEVQKEEARQWVETITATKKVIEVNTPVISVEIYGSEETGRKRVLKAPLTFILHHKEQGYDPVCSTLVTGDPDEIWTEDGCLTLPSTRPDFTKCECDHTGSIAVVMAIGVKPLPFGEAAHKAIIVIANILASLLIIITFIMLCLTRLSDDLYFVRRLLCVSLSIQMVMVVVALNLKEETATCQSLAIILHYLLLSNNAWMFNACLQNFLRIRFGVKANTKARIFYMAFGWLYPAVVVTVTILAIHDDYRNASICWVPQTRGLQLAVIVPTSLVTLMSIGMVVYEFLRFDQLVDSYCPGFWYILWDPFCHTVLLLVIFTITWILGLLNIMNNLIIGYFYAGLSFILGSAVYLCFYSTNRKVLVSNRRFIHGDKDEDGNEVFYISDDSEDDEWISVKLSVKQFLEINDSANLNFQSTESADHSMGCSTTCLVPNECIANTPTHQGAANEDGDMELETMNVRLRANLDSEWQSKT